MRPKPIKLVQAFNHADQYQIARQFPVSTGKLIPLFKDLDVGVKLKQGWVPPPDMVQIGFEQGVTQKVIAILGIELPEKAAVVLLTDVICQRVSQGADLFDFFLFHIEYPP